MSICPFAVQQIIPESHTQGAITPTTLILHRAVSSAESLQAYWNSPGNELESHFYVGQHGVIYQFVDTNVRADANMSANGFAVSVETWDGGNTPDAMPWNPEQVDALKRLAAWVCETHGVPRRAATTWNGGGIGGHNWFADEWAGGPRGCPGTARNNQIRNDIIPFVADGGGTKEDNVSAADVTQGLYDTRVDGRNAFDWFKQLRAEQGAIRDQLMGQIVGLQAAVAVLAGKVGVQGGASAAEIEAAVAKAIQDNVVKVDVSVAGSPAVPAPAAGQKL